MSVPKASPPEVADMGSQATDEQWDAVRARLAATLVPKLAVFGSCDSGKSHLFRMLTAQSPLPDMRFAYWDMLSTPQASKDDAFWLTLSEILGADQPFTESDTKSDNLGHPPVQLPVFLADPELPPRVVLILDHWDDARENAGEFVNLEALQKLSTFVISQPSTPIETLSRLGLVLVTRFPNIDELVQYAHKNRTAGLMRISGDIERYFSGVQFPFLSRSASIDFLMARQVEADTATELADLSGGWLGLLLAGERRIRSTGALDAEAKAHLLYDDIPTLLGKTVIPLLLLKSEAKGGYLGPLATFRGEYEVNPSTTLMRYALPSAFGTNSLLPPLLAQFLLRQDVS